MLYEFRVSAADAVFFGEEAKMTRLTTDEVPLEAPINVTVTVETPDTLRITWNPPKPELANERILMYSVSRTLSHLMTHETLKLNHVHGTQNTGSDSTCDNCICNGPFSCSLSSFAQSLRRLRTAALHLLCLLAPFTGLLTHFAQSFVGQLKYLNMRSRCECVSWEETHIWRSLGTQPYSGTKSR